MNELATIPKSEVVAQVPGTTDISATATAPDEMAQAQSALIAWCRNKVSTLKEEHKELAAAHAQAVKNKWAAAPLGRQVERCKKRVEFYKRMEQALVHGYVIVPNFPVTAFAIRTGKDKPLKMMGDWRSSHEQLPEGLPAGEGEYKNPFPEIWQHTIPDPTKEDQTRKTTQYWAEAWKDLDFPLTMAKPRIMEATSQAMALKIFDDFGILPGRTQKDPIIVARLKDPRSTKYDKKWITFMVAWHLNTRDL